MNIKSIRLENITKRFVDDTIFENLSLTIPGEKFFAILGPSGSGKTTLLRLIAGFEKPDSGTIYLGNRNITAMPINERKINTVFQHYALFPHLNVFDNVAYGLQVRGYEKDIIEDRVAATLAMVHLEKMAYRQIQQLSGGQQQRIALARAVINEPEVLLLDEPLAALDMKLRERMLVELMELQETLGSTFVYITHDQLEALTVADSMAIINHHGEIEQIGTPKEIYEFPRTTFIARFVGTTNIFKGTVLEQDNILYLAVDGLGKLLLPFNEAVSKLNQGQQITTSIRPEKIKMTKEPCTGFTHCLTGIVTTIVYHGNSTRYNIALANGSTMRVFVQNEEHIAHNIIEYDERVHLYWQQENLVVLER